MSLEEKSGSAASNTALHAAKKAKNDEFYTQLTDIEKELRHYKNHFRGKVVFCNCDDSSSEFWNYFKLNFGHFGLAKLVATHYAQGKPAYKLEYFGSEHEVKTLLTGDGDFRSDECVELLKQADIVVTNPPFSLFREYVSQLVAFEKKFLVLGNNNAVTYKEVFRLIRDNEMWLGYGVNKTMEFRLAGDYARWSRVDAAGNKYGKVPAISWFTNLSHQKRNEELILFRTYAGSEESYPRYFNYDAIEVSKVSEIPMDFYGEIGVPITFLEKYNPTQFELVGSSRTLGKRMADIAEKGTYSQGGPRFYLDNGDGTYRRLYERIVIKRRQAA